MGLTRFCLSIVPVNSFYLLIQATNVITNVPDKFLEDNFNLVVCFLNHNISVETMLCRRRKSINVPLSLTEIVCACYICLLINCFWKISFVTGTGINIIMSANSVFYAFVRSIL